MDKFDRKDKEKCINSERYKDMWLFSRGCIILIIFKSMKDIFLYKEIFNTLI